jgi:hypothetical protein
MLVELIQLRCGALAHSTLTLRLRYQRADAEEHQREEHVRDHAVAEERNRLGVALNQARKVLGVSDVAERPDSKVAGEEEANAAAQPRAKNLQRLDAIAQQQSDEAGNKIPTPHHDLVERKRKLINAEVQIDIGADEQRSGNPEVAARHA